MSAQRGESVQVAREPLGCSARGNPRKAEAVSSMVTAWCGMERRQTPRQLT